MKEKVKVYPYVFVTIGAQGELTPTLRIAGYHMKENFGPNFNSFTIPLTPIEIEVECADDLRPQMIAALRAAKQEKTAVHTALMTAMQFMENSLLGLGAPEILDQEESRGRPVDIDGQLDDDIPF